LPAGRPRNNAWGRAVGECAVASLMDCCCPQEIFLVRLPLAKVCRKLPGKIYVHTLCALCGECVVLVPPVRALLFPLLPRRFPTAFADVCSSRSYRAQQLLILRGGGGAAHFAFDLRQVLSTRAVYFDGCGRAECCCCENVRGSVHIL
jgi:hypothetical protein